MSRDLAISLGLSVRAAKAIATCMRLNHSYMDGSIGGILLCYASVGVKRSSMTGARYLTTHNITWAMLLVCFPTRPF